MYFQKRVGEPTPRPVGGVWLGQLGYPLFLFPRAALEETGGSWQAPVWLAFRDTLPPPSMSFQERTDTALDQLWKLRLFQPYFNKINF